MRTVQEIYAAYRIMPGLQMHQLRVAAVGKTLCDHFSGPVDTHLVVLACLFHDMGNIIKSDLATFPEFLGDKDRIYWEGVKQEFFQRYGSNQHEVSMKIAREIGLGKDVVSIIGGTAFSRLAHMRERAEAHERGALEMAVVEYSDLRTAPHGVVSMKERLVEARVRYAKRDHDIGRTEEEYQRLFSEAEAIERLLFEKCSIGPSDINDESTVPLIEELRNYPVE